MSKCDIKFWLESDPNGPFNRMEVPAVTRGRCARHNWSMTDQREVHDDMCPIGRIEDAMDAALDKIKEATK